MKNTFNAIFHSFESFTVYKLSWAQPPSLSARLPEIFLMSQGRHCPIHPPLLHVFMTNPLVIVTIYYLWISSYNLLPWLVEWEKAQQIGFAPPWGKGGGSGAVWVRCLVRCGLSWAGLMHGFTPISLLLVKSSCGLDWYLCLDQADFLACPRWPWCSVLQLHK